MTTRFPHPGIYGLFWQSIIEQIQEDETAELAVITGSSRGGGELAK